MTNYHYQELLERLTRFNQGFGTVNPVDKLINIYNNLMETKGVPHLKDVFLRHVWGYGYFYRDIHGNEQDFPCLNINDRFLERYIAAKQIETRHKITAILLGTRSGCLPPDIIRTIACYFLNLNENKIKL